MPQIGPGTASILFCLEWLPRNPKEGLPEVMRVQGTSSPLGGCNGMVYFGRCWERRYCTRHCTDFQAGNGQASSRGGQQSFRWLQL